MLSEKSVLKAREGETDSRKGRKGKADFGKKP